MTTLVDLRNNLRTLLNDSVSGSYLWSDAALNLHINNAIRGFSASFPREAETTIATVAEQAEYNLPADCLSVVRICLDGRGGAPLQEGGDDYGEGFEAYGGKLVLLPAPSESGQEIAVRYLAPHAHLASDGDASTVPAADEDLLLALAASQVLASLATDEAKRRALEGQTGQSTKYIGAIYEGWYRAGVRERQARIRLRKLIAS